MLLHVDKGFVSLLKCAREAEVVKHGGGEIVVFGDMLKLYWFPIQDGTGLREDAGLDEYWEEP